MDDAEAAQRAREKELRENRAAKKEFLSDKERVSESVKSLKQRSSDNRSLRKKIDREIRRAEITGKPSRWFLRQLMDEENQRKAEIKTSGSQQESTPSIQVAQTMSLNPDNSFDAPPSGGSFISMNGIGEDAADMPAHPWQIVLRKRNNITEYKIESESKLYEGYDDWGSISVSGLNQWQSTKEGYFILKGTVTDDGSELKCTSAEIKLENALPDKRVKFQGSPKIQYEFSVQLGYLYQEGDTWKVRQNMWQNLTISQICVDGYPALYPM